MSLFGKIVGTAISNSARMVSAPVLLFDHSVPWDSRQNKVTNAQGNFTFINLDTTHQYQVLVLDTGPSYNASTFGWIPPSLIIPDLQIVHHFEGANGAHADPDTGYYNTGITFKGGAQISTSQLRFGTSSLRCTRSTSSYVYFNGINNTSMTSEPSWTVEFWFYPIPVAGVTFSKLLVLGGGFNIQWSPLHIEFNPTTGALNWFGAPTGVNSHDYSGLGGVANFNAWNHVAYCRDSGSSYNFFLNGTRQSQFFDTRGSFQIDSRGITLGAEGNGSVDVVNATTPFDGYFDDFALTSGVCKYAGATYTIPAGPAPDQP